MGLSFNSLTSTKVGGKLEKEWNFFACHYTILQSIQNEKEFFMTTEKALEETERNTK